jgi:hypothetical protein
LLLIFSASDKILLFSFNLVLSVLDATNTKAYRGHKGVIDGKTENK